MEEVRQKMIHLNSRNQLKVIVNQMFSKELTERRNNALIKRKEYLILHPDLQIKLDYPATLKSRRKGQNNKWLILEEEFKKKRKEKKERTCNNAEINTSINYF